MGHVRLEKTFTIESFTIKKQKKNLKSEQNVLKTRWPVKIYKSERHSFGKISINQSYSLEKLLRGNFAA